MISAGRQCLLARGPPGSTHQRVCSCYIDRMPLAPSRPPRAAHAATTLSSARHITITLPCRRLCSAARLALFVVATTDALDHRAASARAHAPRAPPPPPARDGYNVSSSSGAKKSRHHVRPAPHHRSADSNPELAGQRLPKPRVSIGDLPDPSPSHGLLPPRWFPSTLSTAEVLHDTSCLQLQSGPSSMSMSIPLTPCSSPTSRPTPMTPPPA
jgi:hypothetical protein